MNLLKCIPFILLIGFISCSKDDSNIDEFLGQWELSNYKWIDCENSGTDHSVDIAVASGGCFDDGCYSTEILGNNKMIISYGYESYDYDTNEETFVTEKIDANYIYDVSTNSIQFTSEEFEGVNTVTIKNNELVLKTLEDGCDTEFRMRKI